MKTFKNVLVLTIITVVAGFLLGYVYDITKGPIKASEERNLQIALKEVFPEANDFEKVDEANVNQGNEVLKNESFEQETINNSFYAKDGSGKIIGKVIDLTTSNGYGGDINIILGIQSDGTINGMEVLSLSETPGLGMRADDPEFEDQFDGKNVASIVYTKNGATNDYEIDALSGATITTNAVTNAVNAGLKYFHEVEDKRMVEALGGEGNE